LPELEIKLVGSRSTGVCKSDSDIDVVVVVPGANTRRYPTQIFREMCTEAIRLSMKIKGNDKLLNGAFLLDIHVAGCEI
jgi:predicted nucleotidyltransferase